MNVLNRKLSYCFIAFVSIFSFTSVQAVTIDGGPDWPGLADVSGATHPGSMTNGGQTSTYPNIGNSSVENLYFGLSSSGLWSLGTALGSESAFTHYGNGTDVIEYRGSADIKNAVTGIFTTYDTRLLLTVNSGGVIISDATTQALANDVDSLIHITGSSFSVTREIEIFASGVWQDADPWFFNHPTDSSDQLVTNVGTAFYWEDATVVPVPAAVWLFGSGLIGLVGMARRKRG